MILVFVLVYLIRKDQAIYNYERLNKNGGVIVYVKTELHVSSTTIDIEDSKVLHIKTKNKHHVNNICISLTV